MGIRELFTPTVPQGPEVTYIKPEYPPVRVTIPDTPPPGSQMWPVDPRRNMNPTARGYLEGGVGATWYLLGQEMLMLNTREGSNGLTEKLLALLADESQAARHQDALTALFGGCYAFERRDRSQNAAEGLPGLLAAVERLAGSPAAAASLRTDLEARARAMLTPCWAAVEAAAVVLGKQGMLASGPAENLFAATIPAMPARVGWRLLAQVDALTRRVAALEGKG